MEEYSFYAEHRAEVWVCIVFGALLLLVIGGVLMMLVGLMVYGPFWLSRRMVTLYRQRDMLRTRWMSIEARLMLFSIWFCIVSIGFVWAIRACWRWMVRQGWQLLVWLWTGVTSRAWRQQHAALYPINDLKKPSS